MKYICALALLFFVNTSLASKKDWQRKQQAFDQERTKAFLKYKKKVQKYKQERQRARKNKLKNRDRNKVKQLESKASWKTKKQQEISKQQKSLKQYIKNRKPKQSSESLEDIL